MSLAYNICANGNQIHILSTAYDAKQKLVLNKGLVFVLDLEILNERERSKSVASMFYITKSVTTRHLWENFCANIIRNVF